jgi:diamine N-acetyltransferase
VTSENVRAACKLKTRPGQEDLVAPVAWSLAEAYTVPDIAWPRLIYDGDQLVGFIMAAFAPEAWVPQLQSAIADEFAV